MEFEVKNRKSVFVGLNDGYHKEHDYIEVTQWTNGEGYDIHISNGEKMSVHFTEWGVLKKIIKKMDNGKL